MFTKTTFGLAIILATASVAAHAPEAVARMMASPNADLVNMALSPDVSGTDNDASD